MASDIYLCYVLNLEKFEINADCRELREGARVLVSLRHAVLHLLLLRATGTVRFAIAISHVLPYEKPPYP
jgi:hypothetical protein